MKSSSHSPLFEKEHDPYSAALSRNETSSVNPVLDRPEISNKGQLRFGSAQRSERVRGVSSSFASLPKMAKAAGVGRPITITVMGLGQQQTPSVGAARFGPSYKWLEHPRPTRTIDRWNLVRPDLSAPSAALRELVERLATVNVAQVAMPRREPEATLYGKVESIDRELGVVSLLNEKTGEVIEADCPVDILLREGIGEGDEFVCEVVKDGPTVMVRFERLEPNKVTQQRIDEILREVDDLAL